MSENFRGRRSRSVEHDARKNRMHHSPNESYDDLKVGSFPNDMMIRRSRSIRIIFFSNIIHLIYTSIIVPKAFLNMNMNYLFAYSYHTIYPTELISFLLLLTQRRQTGVLPVRFPHVVGKI